MIELLVCLSLMTVLMGLALPAVQHAREAARRLQCSSNLHQLGIALHLYQGTAGCLPPGRMLTYDPRFRGPRPPCTSPAVDKGLLVFILPQLGQTALYDAINHDLSVPAMENTTIHPIVVHAYSCPSDWGAGRPRELAAGELAPYAAGPPGRRLSMTLTSYSGCYGSFVVDAIPRPESRCRIPSVALVQANGVFNDVSPIRLADVTDGLSTTLFVVEKATATFDKLGRINPSWPTKYGWWVAGNWGDTLASTFYPPNMPWRVSLVAGAAHSEAASSLHPGGFHVLMGDGATRFVKDSIQSWSFDPRTGIPLGAYPLEHSGWAGTPAPGIWQSPATRAGGEVVPADW